MYRRYGVPICLLLKSFRCWWNPYFVRLETAQHQSNPIDHLWYRVVTGLPPFSWLIVLHARCYICNSKQWRLSCLVATSTHSIPFVISEIQLMWVQSPLFCVTWIPFLILDRCFSMFFLSGASAPHSSHDVQGAMAATAPADRVKSSPVSRRGSTGETAKAWWVVLGPCSRGLDWNL